MARKGIRARVRGLLFIGTPLATLLAAPTHAAGIGLTGTFDPQTWVVVNTSPAQTLSYNTPTPTTFNFSCEVVNDVACVDDYTETGLTLLGSDPDYTGGGTNGTARTTTLTLTNSYWRPYLITFNWTFDGPGGSLDSSQTATILTNPGFLDTVSTQGYTFTSVAGQSYTSEAAIAYLPPGATLSFSLYTNNASAVPVFTLTNFDAVEIPAPLPISGGAAAFGCSRRLRRRQRHARRQLLAMPGTASGAPSSPEALRALRAEQQQRQAIQRYGALLGRPVQRAAAARPIQPSAGNTGGQPESPEG